MPIFYVSVWRLILLLQAFGGPVAAIGFSAGGHLIASLAAREQQDGGATVFKP